MSSVFRGAYAATKLTNGAFEVVGVAQACLVNGIEKKPTLLA